MSGRAIQTDANISPANYGGPLIDIEGHVLGICVPLSPRAQGAASGVDWYDSGIGFAIPLSGAKRLIDEMKTGKHIKPGKLGVLPERWDRAEKMVAAMEEEAFGNCTNHEECEAACPKGISVDFIANMNRDFLRAKLKGWLKPSLRS